jgi:hypothetical protein
VTPGLPLALTPGHPLGLTPELLFGLTPGLPFGSHPYNSLCLGREPKARVATGKFSKPKTSIGENSNYVKTIQKLQKKRPSFKDDIQ